LPTTRIALATSVARLSTFTVPFTYVPWSVQLAPLGTRRLSTVMAPSDPRQARSSAMAGEAGTTSAAMATAPATSVLRIVSIVFSDLCAIAPWRPTVVSNVAAGGERAVRTP
jgi:hypothetical protein